MSIERAGDGPLPLDIDKAAETEQPVHSASISDIEHDIVEFDGPDDPANPKNWSKAKKWRITGAMGGMTFVVTFASSVFVSHGLEHQLQTTID